MLYIVESDNGYCLMENCPQKVTPFFTKIFEREGRTWRAFNYDAAGKKVCWSLLLEDGTVLAPLLLAEYKAEQEAYFSYIGPAESDGLRRACIRCGAAVCWALIDENGTFELAILGVKIGKADKDGKRKFKRA